MGRRGVREKRSRSTTLASASASRGTIRFQLNYAVLLVNRDQPQRALQQLKLLEPRLLAFPEHSSTPRCKNRYGANFCSRRSSFQDVVFTLAVQHKDLSEFRAFAAEVLLRWKQVQRDEDAYLAGLTRTSKDAVVTRLGQEIRDLRRNVSHMTNRPQDNSETHCVPDAAPSMLKKWNWPDIVAATNATLSCAGCSLMMSVPTCLRTALYWS